MLALPITSLLLAPLLLLLALGVLFYIGALIFGAIRMPLGQAVESRRIARHLAQANECDRLIDSGQIEPALHEIRSAFYLHTVTDRKLGAVVANHHTGLLSRVIALTSARRNSVRLLSLAKTDRLLSQRAALQKRLFALRQGGAPADLAHVERQLAENARALAKTLEQLLEEARAAREETRFH